MALYTLVAGTHDDGQHAWWRADSPFVALLRERGHDVVDAARPFEWSTDLDGLGIWRTHNDWHAAGVNLFAYIVPPRCPERRVPPADTHVITHSHGMAVALYAAAGGLKIDTLTTVMGPVRRDLKTVTEAARPNIRYWRHIYTDGDWWQRLGSLGDWGWSGRSHPAADLNIKVPGAGHSRLVRDPDFFREWWMEWV